MNPSNTNEHTGWHVAVDEREAIEAIPPNEVAWHAGDGTGPGNSFSIGLEICESGDRAKTLLNAAKVAAWLLKEHGLTPAGLRQHFDWNKKNCPRILRKGNRWQEFVASVQAWFAREEPKPEQPDTRLAAIDLLAKEGIITSPEYWRLNSETGRMVRGDFVASLLLKMAQRLRELNAMETAEKII